MTATATTDTGRRLALQAEGCYLVNLLLLPGVGFAVLLWLYLQHYDHAPPLARCHLAQTVRATLWGATVLISVTALTVAFGGTDSPLTWTVALLNAISIHTVFVLLGVVGLAHALAGNPYRFPLVGADCHDAAD